MDPDFPPHRPTDPGFDEGLLIPAGGGRIAGPLARKEAAKLAAARRKRIVSTSPRRSQLVMKPEIRLFGEEAKTFVIPPRAARVTSPVAVKRHSRGSSADDQAA